MAGLATLSLLYLLNRYQSAVGESVKLFHAPAGAPPSGITAAVVHCTSVVSCALAVALQEHAAVAGCERGRAAALTP